MVNVIMISGKKGVGKDWIATELSKEFSKQDNTEVHILRFGDALKDIICATFNISRDQLDLYKNNPEDYTLDLLDQTTKGNFSDIVLSTNFRTILQRFGNEGMKPIIGEDVWALIVANKVQEIYEKDWTKDHVFLIPDFRFNIEWETMFTATSEKVGIQTLRIEGEGYDHTDTHASETELDSFSFDEVFINRKHECQAAGIHNLYSKLSALNFE